LFGQKFHSDRANILTNKAAVLIISPEISDSVAIEVPFFLQHDLAVCAGIVVNPVIDFAGAAAVLFQLGAAAVLIEHPEGCIADAAFITFFSHHLIVIVIIDRVGSSSAFGIHFASNQLAIFEIAPAIDLSVPMSGLFLPDDFAGLERVVVNPQVWNPIAVDIFDLDIFKWRVQRARSRQLFLQGS